MDNYSFTKSSFFYCLSGIATIIIILWIVDSLATGYHDEAIVYLGLFEVPVWALLGYTINRVIKVTSVTSKWAKIITWVLILISIVMILSPITTFFDSCRGSHCGDVGYIALMITMIFGLGGGALINVILSIIFSIKAHKFKHNRM